MTGKRKGMEGLGKITDFAKRFAANPRAVGSLTPSGKALAKAMADSCGDLGADHVLELGAGCGAITTALTERFGVDRVLAVEIDPRAAEAARKGTPGVRVEIGCAGDWTRKTELLWSGRRWVAASSLPFRSMPPSDRERISAALEDAVGSGGASGLVQYSYAPVEPFQLSPKAEAWGLGWRMERTVMVNMPPAFVWVLERGMGAIPLPEGSF